MTQELYALGNDRSANFVRSFLRYFLKNWKVFSDDFPVPEAVDNPVVVFQSEDEILNYLELHTNEPYGLYWNATVSGEVNQAMVFYTRDSHAIFGLSVPEGLAHEWLDKLVSFLGAKYAMFGSEQRPPEAAEDFIADANGPKKTSE